MYSPTDMESFEARLASMVEDDLIEYQRRLVTREELEAIMANDIYFEDPDTGYKIRWDSDIPMVVG